MANQDVACIRKVLQFTNTDDIREPIHICSIQFKDISRC